MPKTTPFEAHTDRYEDWFEEHEAAYRAELDAVDRLLPAGGRGLEIGVGSGRFAAPLGVGVGVDPSGAMLDRAHRRGIDVVRGVAEFLPFRAGAFDAALVVTTICFVDDVPRTLAEAARVLAPGGRLVVGFVDEDSPLGRRYRETQAENPFYRDAVFVSTEELVGALEDAGFTDFEFVQTVYHPPGDVDDDEPVESGYGEGSFVAVGATR
jgi:SAM-dependent methyltransferase